MFRNNTVCTALLGLYLLFPGSLFAQAPQTQRGTVALSEFNVRVESDIRTFVVMAAVNAAGFDYEPGAQPLTPSRAEIRKDLAGLDPQIRTRLAAFYKSQRRAGVDEAVDALRYAALSLLMSPPPSFEVYLEEEKIPEDLRPLLRAGEHGNIVQLVRDFYLKSGIKELAPKYMAAADRYAGAMYKPVGETIYEVLNYFHTTPQTIINMRPLVIESGEESVRGGQKTRQQIVTRNRSRQVFVVVDPLAGYGASLVRDDMLNRKDDLLSRKTGDDYIVLVGPSRTANTDAVRQALIRFVLDPIIEKHLRAALEHKEKMVKLVASIPTASKQLGASVYLIIRESLARAAEVRMRRIESIEAKGGYSEDDAVYDLAQGYLRGAALSFHFYDSLKGLEKVGISIDDFIEQMVATTDFDREAARSKQFEPVVARVAAARRSAASSVAPGKAELLAHKILASNDLISQRRFGEAKSLLEEILAAEPNNARALFGMAQVVNQTPSQAEQDPRSDEDDKIQAQYDRLNKSLAFYRKAIESASPESDRWLIQWCHVFSGRILDFQEFRADAVAQYEKAIAIGDVPNGAYKEAVEGKQRPYGQKPNQ